jgi:iron complex outermembrane receptor protein
MSGAILGALLWLLPPPVEPAEPPPSAGRPESPDVDAGADALPPPDRARVPAAPRSSSARAQVKPYQSVVTAPPRTDRAPREDPVAAASVVFPDDSPRALDDLGDLLAEVPGVIVTRSGGIGDFATVSLRGSNPDEVKIYVDGVPLNLAAGGGIDISTLPLGDVERVEIYRGTMPIGFPESALGGIISITTRAPSADRVSARAGSGSFGTMFGDASLASKAGPFHLYLGAHALAGNDGFRYHNDNGTLANPADDSDGLRQNDHLSQLDGVARATLELRGRRQLGLGLVALARDQGLPGLGIRPTLHSHFETARGIAYATYDSRDDLGAGGRLHAQLFLSAQRDRFHDPDHEIGALAAETDDTTVSTGGTLTASRPLAAWLRGSAMGEARRETFQPIDHLEATPVGVPAERRVAAAGVELDLWWRRLDLDLIPTARIEAVRDVVSGRDALFQRQRAASPPVTHLLPILRLGLARPLTARVTLKANAGRYGRVPSFLELYGDTGPLLGNPLLRPERGWNGDLGAEVQAGGARLSFHGRSTVFAARVDDLIEWVPLSYAQARVENLGRANIYGLEQDLALGLGGHVRLTGQATYLEARDASDVLYRRGKQLPLRPRYHAYLRPELRRLLDRHGVSLGAYLEGDLRAGAFSDDANLTALPDRLLIGAGLTIDVSRARMRLTLSAKNLTDSRALDLPWYPLPGRSVFASLMWSNRLDETPKE